MTDSTTNGGPTSAAEDVFKDLQNFGRYQKLQYFIISLPLCMLSMSMTNYVFVAENVEYRCRVPECETNDPQVGVPSWWPDATDAKCLRPVIDLDEYAKSNGTCTNATFLQEFVECRDWVYESNNSIVSELNLGCESWKATLVGSVHNSGMVVSMLLAGWISDKIGRKITFILYSVGGVIGVVKIFLNNYYVYIGVEFLESFLSSGLLTVAPVLMIEIAGESKRVLAGLVFSYGFYAGEIIFAFVAMGLRYWKSLILFAYAPMILFASYGFVLKESTRWQMLRGRTKEAKETFKAIAKMNKLNISSKAIDDLKDEELRIKLNVLEQTEKESIGQILRSKEIMVRLGVTSVCFFTSSFAYCGLLVLSVLLPGNKYTNFALNTLMAFPGDLFALYSFNKYGRKITMQCAYIATAVFVIAQAYTPDSISWLKVLFFLFGNFGVVICFTGSYTYSMELFPTSVRGSLVGCGNTAARIGSMLAPLSPLLEAHMSSLSSILISATAVLSGALLMFTPETKTMPLFDTIAQVEAYEKKNKSISA